MTRPQPTISEIARRAGVSQGTASAILSGSSKPTRRRDAIARAERVRAIAAELGYRANASARSLAAGRFGAIGLLSRHGIGATFDPVLRGVCRAAEAQGLTTVVAEIGLARLAQDETGPRLLRELCVDGLIAHYNHDIPVAALDEVRATRLPLVWTNAKEASDCVHPDDHGALEAATRELLARGRRRIAYVSHPPAAMNHYSWHDRLEGHRAALAAAGREPRILEVAVGELADPDALLRRWHALLASPDRPDAILIADQPLAPALLRAADRRGLELGRDLILLPVTMRSEPAASGWPGPHLVVPMARVAERAVDLLARRIAAPQRPLPSSAISYDPIRRPELLGGQA